MNLDACKTEDELALRRFLAANGFADLASAVDEVRTRALRPEQAVAELGQASPLVGGLVNDVMAAGDPHAVDISAVVRNGLECRAAFAAVPAVEMDAMIEWLQTAPSWKIDFLMSRVTARADGHEIVETDAEYAAAYAEAERVASRSTTDTEPTEAVRHA
jgi:hypothetical protein